MDSHFDPLASVVDLAPDAGDFRQDVLDGLSAPDKALSCKYLYDEEGSRLFDLICDLPEYYPTRTETALLESCAGDIAGCIGSDVQLIEYGCGSVVKIRALLEALRPAAYVAVDISREHLFAAARALARDFPETEVHAVCADFTKPFEVPRPTTHPDARRVGFFPGSTLGNFTRPQAAEFLAGAARFLGEGGGFLIGIDTRKDEAILHAAYNDVQGVTAAFNLNMLTRINRELGADFDLEKFAHRAEWNAGAGRIEIHIESLADQEVRLDGRCFGFAKGERIHTENSHKYGIDEFQEMARRAGFTPAQIWTDEAQLFSVHYLELA